MDDFTLAVVTTLIALAALGWGFVGWKLYDASVRNLDLGNEVFVDVIEMLYEKDAEIYKTADGGLRVRRIENGDNKS